MISQGALKIPSYRPDSSLESIRESVDNINAALGGKKRLDLFQCSRVDPNIPIEEAMKNLKVLVEEGKFDYIGLSECKAETIERAHKVSPCWLGHLKREAPRADDARECEKVHPVAAVEIEVSAWSYEEETKKVIETTRKLGIPVIAYSCVRTHIYCPINLMSPCVYYRPLGRGLLSGKMKPSDLDEKDYRRRMSRFQEEVSKAFLGHSHSLINDLFPLWRPGCSTQSEDYRRYHGKANCKHPVTLPSHTPRKLTCHGYPSGNRRQEAYLHSPTLSRLGQLVGTPRHTPSRDQQSFQGEGEHRCCDCRFDGCGS